MELPLEQFEHYGSKFGHHMSWCRPCFIKSERERSKRRYREAKLNPPKAKPPISEPTECKHCHVVKNPECFAHTKTKMRLWCIDCLHEKQASWGRASVKRKKALREECPNDGVECTTCHETVPRKMIIPGRTKCKKCTQEYINTWKSNTERGRQSNLAGMIREKTRLLLRRECLLDDFEPFIGCTVREFQKHIRDLCEPGMTMKNYGYGDDKWQIDHIEPLASFDLEDDAEKSLASHYTNCRPMWQTDHNTKRMQDYKTCKKKRKLQSQ